MKYTKCLLVKQNCILLLILLFSFSLFSNNDVLAPGKHYLCINGELFFAPVSLHANSGYSNQDFIDPRIGLIYSFPGKWELSRIILGLNYSFFDIKNNHTEYTKSLTYEGEPARVIGKYPDYPWSYIKEEITKTNYQSREE